jgi:NADP-dependent 3-hydroxy acid dehydrogenase YdfG
MDLQDKIAVVTGASRGIGQACAEAFVQRGARVFGLARSTDHLQALRDELGEAFVPVACDVRERASVEGAFQTVQDAAGRCDVLVNNAGLGRFGPVDELAEEDWHAQIDTNLTGVYLCAREAVALMKAQDPPGGHILNIASIAGLVGNPGLTAYNASKFGVRGFSEALMKEVRSEDIRVTCIYPGSVDTDFSDSDKPYALHADDIAETVLYAVGLPHRALASEIVIRPTRTK